MAISQIIFAVATRTAFSINSINPQLIATYCLLIEILQGEKGVLGKTEGKLLRNYQIERQRAGGLPGFLLPHHLVSFVVSSAAHIHA